jgi:hypothetical protein
MSDEDGEEIGVNVHDDEDELIEEEEAAAPQPVEIVREEIMTITKDPDIEEKVSVMDNIESEADLREVVNAQSVQLSRLTDVVESLQSQIKQMDRRRVSGNKTSSVRKRNNTKTKKNKATTKKTKGKSTMKKK